MAQITNFGKAWLMSMATRLAHPSSPLLYSVDPRIESLSLWMILLRDTYFGPGINVDHRTLTLAHAQGAGSNAVIGLGSHSTADPWYTGNSIPLGVSASSFPPFEPDNDADSATLNLFAVPRAITFAVDATYPFTVGGIAFCLSNMSGVPGVSTTPGDTEIIAIHEFASPATVTPTSSGQVLTLTGGTAILSEA